jgi:hypothetical protein
MCVERSVRQPTRTKLHLWQRHGSLISALQSRPGEMCGFPGTRSSRRRGVVPGRRGHAADRDRVHAPASVTTCSACAPCAEATTRSPGARCWTSVPTASTLPAHFKAERHRGGARAGARFVSRQQVGAIEARGAHADQHVIRPQGGFRQIVQFDPVVAGNRCFHEFLRLHLGRRAAAGRATSRSWGTNTSLFMVRLLSIATSIARTSRGAGLRRQRRQHHGAAAREQGVKPFVVITVPRNYRTPKAAFARAGVVRPQLKLDRFPDKFLCLTPAILLSYPTEWLRDGSGPSPLNRWEIRKANESQMH